MIFGKLMSQNFHNSQFNPMKLYLLNEPGQSYNRTLWPFVLCSAIMPEKKPTRNISNLFGMTTSKKDLVNVEMCRSIAMKNLLLFQEDSDTVTQELIQLDYIKRVIISCIPEDSDVPVVDQLILFTPPMSICIFLSKNQKCFAKKILENFFERNSIKVKLL